jgi:hypothetical protein
LQHSTQLWYSTHDKNLTFNRSKTPFPEPRLAVWTAARIGLQIA